MRELPFTLPCLKFNFVLKVMLSTSLVFPQEFRIAVMDDSIMIFKASSRLTRERRPSFGNVCRITVHLFLDVEEDR
jgi:hypothetical protein